MTIAQALKEKNRLLSVIKKIKEKLQKYNQVAKGNERPYDVNSLYEELLSTQHNLVELKTAIHIATSPVRHKVFEQSELKDRLVLLRSLPCENGIVRDRYAREEGYEVESVYNAKDLDEKITRLEKQIDAIQDDLDKFNHTTEVNL